MQLQPADLLWAWADGSQAGTAGTAAQAMRASSGWVKMNACTHTSAAGSAPALGRTLAPATFFIPLKSNWEHFKAAESSYDGLRHHCLQMVGRQTQESMDPDKHEQIQARGLDFLF